MVLTRSCFCQILRDEDRWEFPRHQLKILSMLGEGSFGQVWKCEAENIDGVKGIILRSNFREASSLDRIKMTKFWLDFDGKSLQQRTLTLEIERKITPRNVNLRT